MAVIHDTTMSPGKLELLTAWLPAQPWYLDGGHGVVTQRGTRGEVHFLRPGNPDTDVAVPVRRDRPAGDHPRRDAGYLISQILVHAHPFPIAPCRQR